VLVIQSSCIVQLMIAIEAAAAADVQSPLPQFSALRLQHGASTLHAVCALGAAAPLLQIPHDMLLLLLL
jgi:hypothetical protein